MRLTAILGGGPDLLLELDLTPGLVEDPLVDPLERLLARRKTAVATIGERLAEAGADSRVRALVVKLAGPLLGYAPAQELREALGAFRAGGKPAIAWAETFGDLGPGGNSSYYLATACDEIWLQPSGVVGLSGVALEATFVRGALDKAGVEPQVAQRHEYKNAADMFLRSGFTPAHREATERLAASVFEQLVAGVAAGRNLSVPAVRELLDRGPLLAEEARAGGLVDHLGYRDEVYAAARARAGAGAQLRYVARYQRHGPAARVRRQALARRHRSVAVVSAVGLIASGPSRRSPQGRTVGSDTLTAALRAAVRDEKVGAIVLRVNSRGGSYVASDAVWREVGRAREAGTPVVVSMGSVAASGGYFVSMAADTIVADPATLTGSIGVFGGKFVTRDLLERVGVGLDRVALGRHAGMFSSRERYSESELARLDAWLDAVYEDFTAKVAAGRGLDRDRVHEIARGRVWTGADALGLGLVDELGGLRHAVQLARATAGLASDAPARPYPAIPLASRVRRPANSEAPGAVRSIGYGQAWGAFADVAAALGLPVAGPLLMPPVRLVPG